VVLKEVDKTIQSTQIVFDFVNFNKKFSLQCKEP